MTREPSSVDRTGEKRDISAAQRRARTDMSNTSPRHRSEMSEEGAGTRAGRGSDSVRSPRPLDALDRRILGVLSEDGRISVAALAERVHVSRANAYSRIERLQTDGVIEGFGVRINSDRAGLEMTALITVITDQPDLPSLRDAFRAMPEVEYAFFTIGEVDALILVRLPDVNALRTFILDRLHALAAVRATKTMFVLEEVVPRRTVLPDLA